MVFKAAANFTAGYQMNMKITFIDWVLIKPANLAAGWLAISIKNLMYVCLSLQAMVLSNDLFLTFSSNGFFLSSLIFPVRIISWIS